MKTGTGLFLCIGCGIGLGLSGNRNWWWLGIIFGVIIALLHIITRSENLRDYLEEVGDRYHIFGNLGAYLSMRTLTNILIIDVIAGIIVLIKK